MIICPRQDHYSLTRAHHHQKHLKKFRAVPDNGSFRNNMFKQLAQ